MKITINNIDDVFKSKQAGISTLELKGYELIENIMADSSGFGQDWEYALTPEQLKIKIASILKQYPVVYTFLTDIGQFQVYVGVFIKNKKPKNIRKIANNTILIDNKIVRLWDTNIIEQLPDNKLLISNGGYCTRTTHKRIMQFSDVHACAKNFETYINGKKLENDSIIVSGHLKNI